MPKKKRPAKRLGVSKRPRKVPRRKDGSFYGEASDAAQFGGGPMSSAGNNSRVQKTKAKLSKKYPVKKSPKTPFGRALKRSTRLAGEVAKGEEAERNARNLWYAFYKQPAPESKNSIVQKLQAHPNYEKMRRYSIADSGASTLATLAMLNIINDGSLEKSPPPESAPQTPVEGRDFPSLLDSQKVELDATPRTDGAASAAYEGLTASYLPDSTSSDDIRAAKDEARAFSAIEAALEDAEQEALEVRIATRAFGLGSGAFETIPESVREDIAATLADNPQLRAIAEMAGRLYRIFDSKKRTRYKHGRDEIVGIETGREIERLLPTELAKAANPKLRPEFLRGYLEGSLLQFELEGTEKLAKGPFIILADQSGSMKGIRDQWAKAVCLALFRTVKKEGRNVWFQPFADDIGDSYILGGGTDIKTMLEMLQGFMNGGTNFEKPLMHAIEYIEMNRTWKDADILWITDGAGSLPEEKINQAKKKHGFSIFGIQIGGHAGEMEKVCDRIAVVGRDPRNGEQAMLDWAVDRAVREAVKK